MLPYRIDFENDATATAPAQSVVIKDQLSLDFDWSKFELKELGFGDIQLAPPSGLQYYATVVSFEQNGKLFDVYIEVGLHSDTGEVFAQFQSVDPNTQLPPDVLTGFLPPEDGTGRGMGFISYVIQANAGLATGTEIRNIALISFDGQETIATNQIDPHDPAEGTDVTKEALVTIDAGAPSSSVNPLEATNYPSFIVTGVGADDAGGSGIGSFDVYVSDNGGDFTLWLDDAPQNLAVFSGEVDHTYTFYSVAKDNVAHIELAPVFADATTTTVAPPLPDYNSDNSVDAADYILWRKTIGTSGIELYSGADGDGDGTIDQDDFNVWKAHFGQTLPGAGSGTGAATESVEPLAPQPQAVVSQPVESAGNAQSPETHPPQTVVAESVAQLEHATADAILASLQDSEPNRAVESQRANAELLAPHSSLATSSRPAARAIQARYRHSRAPPR